MSYSPHTASNVWSILRRGCRWMSSFAFMGCSHMVWTTWDGPRSSPEFGPKHFQRTSKSCRRLFQSSSPAPDLGPSAAFAASPMQALGQVQAGDHRPQPRVASEGSQLAAHVQQPATLLHVGTGAATEFCKTSGRVSEDIGSERQN